MFFIEWWLVERFAMLAALLIASGVGIWLVRRKRKWIRVAAITLASPVGLLSGLFLALQFMAIGCLSYSSPVYSPDRSRAARIRTDDEGATGGNSSVEVFWNHGFSSQDVYWGQWKSVGPNDLRWKNNSMLNVTHDSPMYRCDSTRRIQVNCVERAGSPTDAGNR